MLIATLWAGDTLVTLVRVIPLDREELTAGEATYNLTFTDIPTDKSYTKSIVSENEAFYALAAWIAADDGEGFPLLTKIRKMLNDDAAMRDQLP